MSHALTLAALYIGGWLAYFAVRAPGPFELHAALAVATSLAAGWAIGRWWAVLLPVAVVPIFASPLPYTPGADPEYGVGMFVAAGFAVLTMALLAAGVLGANGDPGNRAPEIRRECERLRELARTYSR